MENNKNQNKHFGNEMSLKKFERTYKELVYELNWKRHLVTKYEQDLQNALLKQRELERDFDTERKLLEQKIQEVETLKKKLGSIEKECYETSEKASRTSVHLEIVEKENKLLQAQNYKLNAENTSKTSKIEELENRIQCLLQCEKDLNDNLISFRQTITNLDRYSEQIKIDHDRIRKLVNSKEESLKKLEISSNLRCSTYLQARAEVDKLQNECNLLKAELDEERLKTANKTNLKSDNYSKNVIAELNLVSELREDLQAERSISAKLNEVIDHLTKELLKVHQQKNMVQDKMTIGTQTDS
ncbi:tropomyosin-like [Chrysoperla carnea]|uniref:tropomyosin-like n=1 Tax=Chrysoperla carnea TaxID=189513 RepID=UPI001D073361|nr:tropomyosin-like [Chrysoperla carnea]